TWGQVWSGHASAFDQGAGRRPRGVEEYDHAGLRATSGRRLRRQPRPFDNPGCRCRTSPTVARAARASDDTRETLRVRTAPHTRPGDAPVRLLRERAGNSL